MSDRDLLEAAARAAGHTIEFTKDASGERCWFDDRFTCITWNPLEDDGDALRLAVKLGIDLLQFIGPSAMQNHAVANYDTLEMHNDDPYAATRRAIVRAAAAIGEKK